MTALVTVRQPTQCTRTIQTPLLYHICDLPIMIVLESSTIIFKNTSSVSAEAYHIRAWYTRTPEGVKPTCGVRRKNKIRQCKETTRRESEQIRPNRGKILQHQPQRIQMRRRNDQNKVNETRMRSDHECRVQWARDSI